MRKDIYTILTEKLNRAGYRLSPDYQLERNESLVLASRNIVNSIKAEENLEIPAKQSEIASTFNLSRKDLGILLAIINEESDTVVVSEIAKKYWMNAIETAASFMSLTQKGFLSRANDFLIERDIYRVTDRGLMSLLSDQPIDRLDTTPFVRIAKEDKGRSASRPVQSRKWNPAASFQKSEIPYDLSLDMLDEIEVVDTSIPDEPFLDLLDEKVKKYCSHRISDSELLKSVDKNLTCPQNSRFREAFTTIGYGSLPDAQKTFLLLLCRHFKNEGVAPMNFSPKSAPFDSESEAFKELSDAARALVTSGIVVMPPDETYTNSKEDVIKERFMLSPDVVGTLFHGMTELVNYGSLCKQADVWKCSGIEPRTLLFDEEMSQKVDCLKTLVDPKLSGTLMERLNEIGRKSLTCLFYGVPGVGKTELCRQLARSTGRDCVVVDPAKLNGSYWGDTEKNAREVFRAYKYLYKISDRAPILVFNEADGILNKRFTEVTRATEKSENAVQGIILQELETFEGIFVATTNLQNNLDAAADRRFLYKLRFDYPSPEIRSRIIRMKMNWVTEEEATALANEFNLSGGQVDNIASKCIIEKFMTGSEASLEKMRGFCREEVSMRTNDPRHESRIGFIRYPRKDTK